MVVETMSKQDRYKAMQALVNHLDAIKDNLLEVKLGILDTLSHCVAAAADGSLGEFYSNLPFNKYMLPLILKARCTCTCAFCINTIVLQKRAHG